MANQFNVEWRGLLSLRLARSEPPRYPYVYIWNILAKTPTKHSHTCLCLHNEYMSIVFARGWLDAWGSHVGWAVGGMCTLLGAPLGNGYGAGGGAYYKAISRFCKPLCIEQVVRARGQGLTPENVNGQV